MQLLSPDLLGLIFAIFSPYECALCADDGSIPYFPICQGTLPWQPNNIAVMKANCMANVDKLTVLSLDMFAKGWGC